VTPAEISAEARSWLGVQWRHQGRNRAGVDCVGLLIQVGAAFGIACEDMKGYAREPHDTTFLHHLRKYLTPAPAGDTSEGTVGIFRQSRFPCHVGIFSEKNGYVTLINARADHGLVVEELFQDNSNSLHLVECRRFPGAT